MAVYRAKQLPREQWVQDGGINDLDAEAYVVMIRHKLKCSRERALDILGGLLCRVKPDSSAKMAGGYIKACIPWLGAVKNPESIQRDMFLVSEQRKDDGGNSDANSWLDEHHNSEDVKDEEEVIARILDDVEEGKKACVRAVLEEIIYWGHFYLRSFNQHNDRAFSQDEVNDAVGIVRKLLSPITQDEETTR